MHNCLIRSAQSGDEPRAYYVCLKTGDNGQDGEAFYPEDPDASMSVPTWRSNPISASSSRTNAVA